MFQFLRPKKTFPPVQFADDIVIEQPAETVYALLDWASPANAYRARGSSVERVDGDADRFRMVMEELPGHHFDIFVTHSAPTQLYGFGMVATPAFGRIARSHELYAIEPLSPLSCRLAIVNTVIFVPMRVEDMVHEELLVSTANHNALAKLKLQAEQDVDAVRAVAGKTIV